MKGIAVWWGRGDVLVGPDNGLLPAAAEGLGGIVAARLLDNDRLHLAQKSTTFHARDVFCPVAAHLANGIAFEEVGQSIEGAQLVAWHKPLLDIEADRIRCEIIDVDGFGNVRLAAKPDALERTGIASAGALCIVTANGKAEARVAATYGDLRAGRLGLVVDSFGWLNFASTAQARHSACGSLAVTSSSFSDGKRTRSQAPRLPHRGLQLLLADPCLVVELVEDGVFRRRRPVVHEPDLGRSRPEGTRDGCVTWLRAAGDLRSICYRAA
jgi:hypothetical protein